MAQYKCKRCGNIIEVENGAIVAVCDNCLLAQPINAENVSVVPENETVAKKSDVSSEIQTLLKRVYLFLEDEEWEKADEYCEKILDINPEFAEAYLGKIMTEFRVRKREDLINCEQSIKGNKYDKIMRFGDDKIKAEIKSVADAIENRIAPKTKPAEGYSLEHEQLKKEKRKKAVEEVKTKSKKTLKIAVIVIALVSIIIPGYVICKDVLIPSKKYDDAVSLMETGEYDMAIKAFTEMGNFKDCKRMITECYYRKADDYSKNDKTEEAAIAFGKLGDYKDAEERSFALWDEIAVRETISADEYHTVGLKKDGTVEATTYEYTFGNSDYGQYDVEDWKDIVAISAGLSHTVGLKKDGTVVDVGAVNYKVLWENIVAISAGGFHTVALEKDGTVVAVGTSLDGQCDVEGWKDIVAISAGCIHTVGLKKDGTVVAVGSTDSGQCDVEGWKDIVAISAGYSHTVGLKKDGTVVATAYTGDYNNGQCDVEDWENIVAISAGHDHTVGLKKDGTVVAVGDNYCGQCDVEGWYDIKMP